MRQYSFSGSEDALMGTSDAARELKFSESYLRQLSDAGKLPCTRATNGRRLFKLSDLRKFQQKHKAVA